MDKLLIVDGSNLLFQMFYGMPARIVNDQGKAIQGTLGFIGALLMNNYEDLDTLLAKTGEIRKPSIRASVEQNAARIRNNYRLIKLSGSAELPFELQELFWIDQALSTTQVLQRIGVK